MSWLLVIFIAVSGCRSNPHLEGARLDLRNKDYQRALSNINKALESEPKNPEVLLLKGDILMSMLPQVSDGEERTGYVGELMGAYTQAQILNPEHHAHVARQRSVLYRNEFMLAMETFRDADQLGGRERANQFAEAARHFRNASMIIPDSVSALINEAHAYYNAGEAQEAVNAYESAIALGHTDRNLFIHLIRTYELMATELADPGTQPEYYRQMIRVLKIARQHYPDDSEIRRLLLNAYAMSDATEDARSFYQDIYLLEETNPTYLYNYGTLLLRQEDYEEAIPLLSRAVELDSSYVNARFNLGAAYANLGVQVDHHFQAVQDSLQGDGGRIAPNEMERLEARKETLEQSKSEHFGLAILHLEAVKRRLEHDLSDLGSVCHALYLAYAQTNQRSRAEEANICARQSGY